jgi:FRG domain
MNDIPSAGEVFREVFADLRFPFLAADLDRLCNGFEGLPRTGLQSHFGFPLDAPPEKLTQFTSALRGLLRRIDVPDEIAVIFARDLTIAGPQVVAAMSRALREQGNFTIAEAGGRLVWEEQSVWPLCYSTYLSHFFKVLMLHRRLIEERVASTAEGLTAEGFAPENVQTMSEYPRLLPTHDLYAAASLGAWLGGAMNVQYFAYYAAIRQIHHPSLNNSYAKRIGYSEAEAEHLTASGIVALPASLVGPLLHAQGSNTPVLGSIPFDETNAVNPPAEPLLDSLRASPDDPRLLPGFLLDKYYRAPLRARRLDGYAFYGAKDVLRDHYTEFYAGVPHESLLRCKHYCAPVVRVEGMDEVRNVVARVPVHHKDGVFFRGQRKLYLLRRDPAVRRLLFGDSTSAEPSLITAAARDMEYDYDAAHAALKYFLGRKIWTRHRLGGDDLVQKWRAESESPVCKLDLAILALAQHYGLPSHGLDITTSPEVAVWFATHLLQTDQTSGKAAYRKLPPDQWPSNPDEWPVVVVGQAVTNSIQPSLHDCHDLDAFGFAAARPVAQRARFFQGGHSDHQNRLAEAVVCVLRLAPGDYDTGFTFDDLFPAPSDDTAYAAMLEFANTPEFGAELGRHVNRFH